MCEAIVRIISHGESVDSLEDDVIRRALHTAFLETDAKLLSDLPIECDAGSTATTLLRLGRRVFCANTGDSRTVLCVRKTETMCSTGEKFSRISFVPLSEDHKPTRDDEKVIEHPGKLVNTEIIINFLSLTFVRRGSRNVEGESFKGVSWDN